MTEPLAVGAIVLAAGNSSRLGEAKQLLPWRGRPLLRHTVEVALAACSPVIVVLGARLEVVHPALHGLPVHIVENPHWEAGLSTSVRAGVEALGATSLRAAVLLPCDLPLLTAEHLNEMVAAHENGHGIIVSSFEGVWGTPMLFERRFWPELLALSGDRGAQSVARRHPEAVATVEWKGGALDIDTPTDYRRLLGGA